MYELNPIKTDLHVRLICVPIFYTTVCCQLNTSYSTRTKRVLLSGWRETRNHAAFFPSLDPSLLRLRPPEKSTTGYSSSLTLSGATTVSTSSLTLSGDATVSTSDICSFSLMSLAMSLTLDFFESLICIPKDRISTSLTCVQKNQLNSMFAFVSVDIPGCFCLQQHKGRVLGNCSPAHKHGRF